MKLAFYKNNFRCSNHIECGEGASCAIDVLLDIFYYCVFKDSLNVINQHSGLTAKLIEACVEREFTGEAACTARHLVWDWLVENLNQREGEMPKFLKDLNKLAKNPKVFN